MIKQARSKILTLLIALFAVGIIAALLLFFILFPKDMRNDFNRLSKESYDTVLLSMYPADNYEEESYTYWRAMDAIVTTHEIPNLFTLKCYLRKLSEAGTVTTVYLGVLPEKLDAAKLAALLLSYPGIRFEVILPYPELDYWLSLPQEECDSLLQTYRDFIPPLLNHGMISPYFFGGTEWVICNPANYEDSFLTTAQASETIMLHSDVDHGFVITANTLPSPTAPIDALADLIAKHREAPVEYPDLSDWNIVFLGDSVIGNYTTTTSIPSVTGGLTGANVYNLGFGGGSAAEYTDNTEPSLTDIVTALIQETPEVLLPDSQVQKGMTQFLEDAPQGQLCFVINYGLNDYFAGAAMASQDPYDTYTFAGAYRSTVQMLREAFPDAYILLNTPNFTVLFNFGMDYRFDMQYTLADYANTLQELSTELDVGLLDNFNELGITSENFGTYLADGCHPNETGRFLIGHRIAQKLGEMSSQ